MQADGREQTRSTRAGFFGKTRMADELEHIQSAVGKNAVLDVGVQRRHYSRGVCSAIAGRRSRRRWAGHMLPLVILPGAALFIIRSYAIEPNVLAIRRLLWTTRLPLAGLQSPRFCRM